MKHKLKIILLDISYFLLFTIILILTRIIIANFLSQIQGYGGQLNEINVNQNIQEAQDLLSQLTSFTTKAYLFIFILVPLILFILYIIFQGLTFKKEKFSYKRFILISLIPSVLLVLTLLVYNIYFLILFIITSYLAFVLYFYDFKKIDLAYKKIYKLFPMYLLYSLLPMLTIGFFYLTYTRINIGLDFLFILLFAIIFSLIFSLYKTYLIKKLA